MIARKSLTLKTKTADDKYLEWVGFCEKLLERYEKQKAAGAITAKEYEELVKEIKGGSCKQCGKPYREVKFLNQFGMGLYWKQSCNCSPICKMCRRLLNVEYIGGLMIGGNYACPNCGMPVGQAAINTFNKKIGEKTASIIALEQRKLRINLSGQYCSRCHKDLWYEIKCNSPCCYKCGKEIIHEQEIPEPEDKPEAQPDIF